MIPRRLLEPGTSVDTTVQQMRGMLRRRCRIHSLNDWDVDADVQNSIEDLMVMTARHTAARLAGDGHLDGFRRRSDSTKTALDEAIAELISII